MARRSRSGIALKLSALLVLLIIAEMLVVNALLQRVDPSNETAILFLFVVFAFATGLLFAAEGRVGQDHVDSILVADLGDLHRQAVAVGDVGRVQAVQQQVAAPQQAASSMVALAGTEAQSLVDKAKALMADKNWAGALAALKDAASKQLTAEQKSLIDQLIAEVQKAMAGNTATTLKDQAAQTLGGLLGGKK